MVAIRRWALAALVACVAACEVPGPPAPPPPASGRHRVQASGAAADALAAAGATLVADYGSFRVLDASPAALQAAPPAAVEYRNEFLRIALNSGALDTSLRPRPGAPRARATVGVEGKALRLVQFAGPVRPEWLARVEATGVRVVSHVPWNAYLVYGDAGALERLGAFGASAPEVQFEGGYSASHKLDRALVPAGEGSFAVQLVEDPEVNAATLALADGVARRPGTVSRALGYVNLVVHADRTAAEALAARPDVVSVQPWHEPRPLDERQDLIVAGQLAGGVPSGPGYLAWLASKGFTQEQFDASGFGVDVTDSGLDNGTALPNHFGLYRRGDVNGASRVAYVRLVGTPHAGGTVAGCDGHGTINAHIVGGWSDRSAAPHADAQGYRHGLGVAPFARLGASVVFDPGFTSPSYEDLLSRAWSDGMRISSNSWGSASPVYGPDSQRYDALVRDAAPAGSAAPLAGNQEMTIVFAAGNDGPFDGTVGAPANAKNVLAVGASENVHPFGGADRCTATDAEADRALDVASFSSRGPTYDGRVRPDLLAPGTHVTGGVAQAPGQRAEPPASASGAAAACFLADSSGVCGGVASAFFPAGQQWYTASSGTSHSTPAVAGAAALARQWFLNQGRAAPSPAMTKAFLVNAARYMTGTSGSDTLYSNVQGMGLLDLGAAFDGTPRLLRDQEPDDVLTATGQARVFTSTVGDPSRPFRVTLAWTDAPGPTFASAWQNDLDLTVEIGGQLYKGNVFSGASSIPGGVADFRNNVESVFLPAGAAGGFTVTVTAASVSSDGVPGNATPLDQDFALVVSNDCADPPPPAPAGASAAAAGDNTIAVAWTPNGAAAYHVYRAAGPGGPYGLVATVFGPPYLDLGRSGGSTFHYVVRAQQGCAISAPSAEVSATAAGPCILPPVFAGLASAATTGAAICGNALSWAAATPSCGGTLAYDVHRSTASGFTPGPANRIAAGVDATSFVDAAGLSGGTTYHYVVRAVETSGGGTISDGNAVERSAAPFVRATLFRDDFDLVRPPSPASWWEERTLGGLDHLAPVTGCRWHSSSTAYRFGEASGACGGAYGPSSDNLLVLGGRGGGTPPVNGIALPAGGGTLTFRIAYALESGWDGAYLAYSTAGPTGTFTPIEDTPVAGLPFIASGGYDLPFWAASRRGWSGASLLPDGAWREVVVNLDALAGQTIWLGWRARSDSIFHWEGFYLDDVRLDVADPACASCPTPAPPAPSGVAVNATGPNELTVTWTPNGAASYEIHRASAPGGPYVVAGSAAAPPFVDAGRSGGVTYFYVVRARQGCAVSEPSAEVSAAATGPCLSPPSFDGLASAETTGEVVCGNALSWLPATAACGGALTYDVFRSTSAGFVPGPESRIATGVTANVHVDSGGLGGGTTYHYVVRAVETVGGTSVSDGNTVVRSAAPDRLVVAFGDDFDGNRPPSPDAWWTEAHQLGADQLQIVSGCRWHSASSAYRFGQPFAGCGGTYSPFTRSRLVLGHGAGPADGMQLPSGGATLSFRLWYDLESYYDGVVLAYSTAGPLGPFTTVLDVPASAGPWIAEGGYDGDTADGTRGWTGFSAGANGALRRVRVNLDALAGQTAWLAWLFSSNAVVQGEGVFLDDVVVQGRGTCFPDPPPPGEPVRFLISGLPAAVTADEPAAITVTALDALDGVASGYAATVPLSSSDARAVLPAATFSGGVASATVRFRTAGTQALAAADGAVAGSASTVVFAAAPHRAVFSTQPGDVPALAPFSPPVRATVLDPFDNVAVALAPLSLSFAVNPSGAALLGTTTVFPAQGIARFDGVAVDRAGAGFALHVGAPGLLGDTSVPFDVLSGSAAGVAQYFVGGPSTAVPGVAATYTLSARDGASKEVSTYFGTAAVTASDPAADVPPAVPFAWGRAGPIAVTFRTAGPQTLTFADMAGGPSAALVVSVEPPRVPGGGGGCGCGSGGAASAAALLALALALRRRR